MSDCFSDVSGNDDAIGWSIEYTGGIVEDCSIYVGVGPSCNLDNARQVGKFSLTPSAARFFLDRNVYESNSFHLYAGKCRMNDAGAHLRRDDDCSEGDQVLYGERWDTYPLKAVNGSFTDTFIFDYSVATQGEYWTNRYSVFEIGGPFRRYISGHVDVCSVSPSSLVNIDPSSSPVAQALATPTGKFTGSPVTLSAPEKPSFAPTFVPTRTSNSQARFQHQLRPVQRLDQPLDSFCLH
jgi:hypothetical protein